MMCCEIRSLIVTKDQTVQNTHGCLQKTALNTLHKNQEAFKSPRLLGLDIEARHREAFQTALTQAAGLLIGRVGSGALAAGLPVDSSGIAEGVTYVQQAVPDAVARFGLEPDAIAEKLTAKIGVVAAAATVG